MVEVRNAKTLLRRVEWGRFTIQRGRGVPVLVVKPRGPKKLAGARNSDDDIEMAEVGVGRRGEERGGRGRKEGKA
jgi:hypothetical protein